MRSLVMAIAFTACSTLAVAQTSDPGSERTQQPAGQSGAAVSHTLPPGGMAERHKILGTGTSSLSLTADQRRRLKAYFAKSDARHVQANQPAFTVAIGAAVPKQVELHALAPELKTILPTYEGDQYALLSSGGLVIATPDRRIVAIIPDVRS